MTACEKKGKRAEKAGTEKLVEKNVDNEQRFRGYSSQHVSALLPEPHAHLTPLFLFADSPAIFTVFSP